MEFTQVKGNTWVLWGRQLIPVYKTGENTCILFDPGRVNEREEIETALAAAGLTPVGLMLTHMHYDHNENTKYFREKFHIPAAMPRGEADLCRSEATLKNHLFNFTMGMVRKTPRLQDLITPIQREIQPGETSVEFQGAVFGVVATPGHSPDHVCYITPDNICFVGDVIMGGEDLKGAKIPFVFDVTLDLASKEVLRDVRCDGYILSHMEVTQGPLDGLIDENIARVQDCLDLMAKAVDGPMHYSQLYARTEQALGLDQGHPIRMLHLERYLRPYLEYLVDQGRLSLVNLSGACGVGPREAGQ